MIGIGVDLFVLCKLESDLPFNYSAKILMTNLKTLTPTLCNNKPYWKAEKTLSMYSHEILSKKRLTVSLVFLVNIGNPRLHLFRL